METDNPAGIKVGSIFIVIFSAGMVIAAVSGIFHTSKLSESTAPPEKMQLKVQVAECFPNPVSIAISRLIYEVKLALTEKEASEITREICTESLNAGLDPILILAIMEQESRYRKKALSSKGARGLMQIMPETAKYIAEKTGLDIENKDVYEPILNIKLGIRYFAQLKRQFRDLKLALTAYYVGPGKVEDFIITTGEIPTSPDNYEDAVLKRYWYLRRKAARWGAIIRW